MKPPSPIVLAVWISSASLGLAQQAGSLDLTFNPGLGADGTVFCMALQTNGQVVIGGNFQNFNGQPNHYVARLNLDGSLDTTFNVGQGPSGSVQCVAIQTDGKIVIGGSFNGVDGVGRFGVARLRNDGSLDTSFIPPTTETIADALAVQSDGRVLVGGQGLPNFVERLNADGSFDTNFNVGIGANSSVLALGVQPNGQILVGGAFSSFNGTNLLSLARLNADGSLDSNFNPALSMGGGDQWVKCLALMPNGQIVVGGDFQTVNGYTHQGVARLNASGSIDTTFNTPLSSMLPSRRRWFNRMASACFLKRLLQHSFRRFCESTLPDRPMSPLAQEIFRPSRRET